MENKFKDIQIDDVVYVEVMITIAFNRGRSFWMPRKVDRITPTMFVIGDTRYRKNNGRVVDRNSYGDYAKNLGDDGTYHNGEPVTDQTVEYNAYKGHIIGVRNTIALIDILSKRITFDVDTNKIYTKLKEIEAELDTQSHD